uniref:Uncharacterized protein n=1 Tax=Arundo donax TaxID=35708 RepID=A0A0A8ZGX4_ARUDO
MLMHGRLTDVVVKLVRSCKVYYRIVQVHTWFRLGLQGKLSYESWPGGSCNG